MSKTVKAAKPASKRGRPSKGGRSAGRIAVACSLEYQKFFEGLATEMRTNISGAFDRVVAEWCKASGRDEPPKRI